MNTSFLRSIPFCLSVFLMLNAFTLSCKGPEGPQGPAGPAGPSGATGATGSQGSVGNANVQQISYTAKTHTGTADLFISFPTSVSTDVVEKSLLYVYVKQNGKNANGQTTAYWFSVPGETVAGNEYSFYTAAGTSTTPGVFLRRVVNYLAGSETFDAIRIVVVQASSTINGRAASSPVDFRNYEAVRQFYNLPE